MAETLSSKDFGEKLYNSLPPMYRTADEEVNLALKRYLQALGDGGYSHVIEELNGLLSIHDPEKTPEDILPIIFSHYGLDVFHGIPEMYLRNLLTSISEIYARKGTITVIEYLTSIISNVKSEVVLKPDFNTKYGVDVRLEMDYGNYAGDMIDKDHLLRIIKEFVPFFCSVTVVYVYLFYEEGTIKREGSELLDIMNISTLNDVIWNVPFSEESTVLKVSKAVESDVLKINSLEVITGSLLSTKKFTLSNTFYTNSISDYDIITDKGKEYIRVPF